MTAALRKSLFFAKVITSDIPNTLKVSVGKYVLDKRLLKYFKEQTQYYAKDPLKKCKEGDYVIIRELNDPDEKNFTHVIEKLVYERGNFIDPITGKKCAGTELIDDIKRTSAIFGVEPPFLKFGKCST